MENPIGVVVVGVRSADRADEGEVLAVGADDGGCERRGSGLRVERLLECTTNILEHR